MFNNYETNLPILSGERVILRLPNKGDIKSIIQFYIGNKEHLAPFEPIKQESFYTEEVWRNEIKLRTKDFQEGRSLRMFIFDKADENKVIGTVNFNQMIRGVFHACYLGYSLAENRQGKGYMTESLKVAIDYVFDELNLHRIMANYMPHNRKSGEVLKRLGFTVEGYARDYLMINGKWEDHILTSLTNHNWKE